MRMPCQPKFSKFGDIGSTGYSRTRTNPSRRNMRMADRTASIVPTTPDEAITPRGVNHIVINVRDIEESHKFWTEVLGFKQVAYSKRRNGKMRFYSGDHDGRMNHHDIALCENTNPAAPPA